MNWVQERAHHVPGASHTHTHTERERERERERHAHTQRERDRERERWFGEQSIEFHVRGLFP